MNRMGWNRNKKHHRIKNKKDVPLCLEIPYKVKRLRPRKRKPKHQGFTVLQSPYHWIFENPKP